MTTTMETRTYIIPKDLLPEIQKLKDDSIEIEVKTLEELKKEFEEDPYTVDSDYFVKQLKPLVYKF